MQCNFGTGLHCLFQTFPPYSDNIRQKQGCYLKCSLYGKMSPLSSLSKYSQSQGECNTHSWCNYSISCSWRTRATRCITANVLQTKVDAQCDKLATELSWKRLRRSTFSSYSQSFVIANLTNPTCIWRLRWGDPGPRFEFCRYLRRQKTRVSRLSCDVACVILRLAVSVKHRLVTDR